MDILRNLLLVGRKKPPSSIKEKFHLATNSGFKMKTFIISWRANKTDKNTFSISN